MADKFEDTTLGEMVQTKKPGKLFIGELADDSLPNVESILYGTAIVRYKDGRREVVLREDLPQANPKIVKE